MISILYCIMPKQKQTCNYFAHYGTATIKWAFTKVNGYYVWEDFSPWSAAGQFSLPDTPCLQVNQRLSFDWGKRMPDWKLLVHDKVSIPDIYFITLYLYIYTKALPTNILLQEFFGFFFICLFFFNGIAMYTDANCLSLCENTITLWFTANSEVKYKHVELQEGRNQQPFQITSWN